MPRKAVTAASLVRQIRDELGKLERLEAELVTEEAFAARTPGSPRPHFLREMDPDQEAMRALGALHGDRLERN
jgi:hypothetical protein